MYTIERTDRETYQIIAPNQTEYAIVTAYEGESAPAEERAAFIAAALNAAPARGMRGWGILTGA